jgi:HD superfamily phosphohydrolase
MANKIKNLYYFVMGVKHLYKQCKGLDLKPTKANKVDTIVVEGKEINIHYIPDMTRAGCGFAGLSYNPLAKHRYSIMVDDLFYMLSKEAQQAALYHEAGHFKFGHLEERTKIKNIINQHIINGKLICLKGKEYDLLIHDTIMNRDYSQELEADSYAIDMCGKEAVISLLKEFYNIIHNPEIEQRYKHITGETLKFKTPWDECTNIVSWEELFEELEQKMFS